MLLNRIKKPERYLRLCLPLFLAAAIITIGVPGAFSQEKEISYNIPRTQSVPVIDGEISRGEWDRAEIVHGSAERLWLQLRPRQARIKDSCCHNQRQPYD